MTALYSFVYNNNNNNNNILGTVVLINKNSVRNVLELRA